MYGRIYTVNFAAVAVAAAQDLFSLDAAAEKPIEIVGLMLTQVGNSDVGDAQEELLRFAFIRGNTTVGSGGTAPTPRPVKASDPAAGFTARVNDTTVATVGTAITTHEDAFNVRAGYLNWWPLGTETDTNGALLLVVRLVTAPADSITLSGTLYVRELG